jgi:hypothetical protein
MSWPSRTIKDPATSLSERKLDELKWRVQHRLRAAADAANTASKTAVEVAFGRANIALLECRTEDEIDKITQGFAAGMVALKEAIDAVNQ